MSLELTEQQRHFIHERAGQPIDFVDPETKQVYVLIAREQFEKVRSLVAPAPQTQEAILIPEGIRRSQEALRRSLPELLAQPAVFRHWVAYHGPERIGIAPREAALIRECEQRGLREDEYYVGWIDSSELLDEEEVELRPQHVEDDPPGNNPS